MSVTFDEVVDSLVENGWSSVAATMYRNADEFDKIHKLATGFIAHGLSKFDATRLNKLTDASETDPWAFDAMKSGAIELQRMHPLLSNQTATWSADILDGQVSRPSKSGPQPNIAKQFSKSLIHLMVEAAVELGLTRSRHNATLAECSAYDAVKVALEREGLYLTFNQIESFDKASIADPDQEKLLRFFPTEKF